MRFIAPVIAAVIIAALIGYTIYMYIISEAMIDKL